MSVCGQGLWLLLLSITYLVRPHHPYDSLIWCIIYLWQSRIEIEYYSVAYFERITKFDTL